jgi:hypothetical protein
VSSELSTTDDAFEILGMNNSFYVLSNLYVGTELFELITLKIIYLFSVGGSPPHPPVQVKF